MSSEVIVPDLSAKLVTPPGCKHFMAAYHAPMCLMAMSSDHEKTMAIDVGAHIGIVTRWLAVNYPLTWAFEPNKVNRDCLIENMKAENAPGEVLIFDRAVAERCGTAWSAPSPKPKNSGGATVKWEPPGDEVQVVTIDSLNPPEVSFLKIDVQGIGAIKVLEGAERTIRKHRPLVWCEGPPDAEEERFLIDRMGGVMIMRTKDDMLVCFRDILSRNGFRSVPWNGISAARQKYPESMST